EGQRRRRLARSLSARLGPRLGEPVRVHDLAGHRLSLAHVARHAAIAEARRGIGEVVTTVGVAAGAEFRTLHGGEAQAMLVVGAGQRAGGAPPGGAGAGPPTEAPPARRGQGEARPPQRLARLAIVVERQRLPRGEVLAGQRLLVLRLVAAAALAVADRLREV